MITVIGILLALLIPAVQATREAARRMSCQNNLKQIGLAMHGYESTHRSLPWGAKGGIGYSWSTDIAPFMEQSAVSDLTPQPNSVAILWTPRQRRQLAEMAKSVVPGYRCPSQSGPQRSAEVIDQLADRAITNYVGVAGSNVRRDSFSSFGEVGVEAGNGVLTATDCVTHPGQPFTPPAIKFAAISDGLSHTMLVGEAKWRPLGECDVCDRFALYHPDFEKVVLVTDPIHDTVKLRALGIDFSETLVSTLLRPNDIDAGQSEQELSMSSYHPGGVQVAMCDGSVRFFSDQTDDQIRHALGSKANQESLDLN